MMTFLAAANPTEHILPHTLFRLGPVWVTNHMVMATVAGVLMLLTFPLMFRRPISDAPRAARNFFESILEFLRTEVFRPALKEHTDRFVPFLWTLFFFILFCNLLGFIPFGDILGLIGSRFDPKLGKELSEFGGTATGNVSTTGALALCALVMIHLSGIVQVARDLIRGTYGQPHHHEHTANGSPGHEAAHDIEHIRAQPLAADVPQHFSELTNPHQHSTNGNEPMHPGEGWNPLAAVLLATPLYLWNFAPHPFRPQPGQSPVMWVPDVLIWFMLLVLELVGAIIKPFALMIRLFANMIAGHLVLAVLVTFIPVAAGVGVQIAAGVPVTLLSLLIRMLELFVSFLQAYIFVFLTTLFIASAVAPEH